MDKPKKGNTIKIKLNGQNTPFHEEPPKKELAEDKDSTTKVIKINSHLSDSDGFLETAAAKDPVDESFDWIIPETSENDLEEFKITSNKSNKKSPAKTLSSFSTNIKKKNGQPLGPILLSAVFAILIGTSIGVGMLKLVATEQTEKAATETTVTEEQVETGSKTASGKTTSGKTTSAVLSQFTAYVVQGGVFTSKDGAKETAAQLAAKGVPTQVVEMSGKHFIFLGVADSIETAKAIGGQYKALGVESPFAKPLLLDEKKIGEITAKEKDFLESVPSIYQTLSLATSSALVTKAIPEESAKAVSALEEPLKISGIKNEKVKSLKTELTSADEKVKAYQKSKDAKSLNEAQQHLLNFLSTYYAM